MTIAARVSSAELTAQVTDRFANRFLEARLINAPGTPYTPGITDDASFLSFEVTPGTSGYERQVIYYDLGDVSAYTDDGVGLAVKATVFAHDGVNPAIDFSHVALCWSEGNVLTIGDITPPSAAVNGTYTNIPVDTTNLNGTGLKVDITVINNGASALDYAVSIRDSGQGYADGEVVTILAPTLAGLGMTSLGDGPLSFPIATSTTAANAGEILAVARTSSPVQLSAGNEAVFYWNLKQFGYYSV